MNRFDSFPVAHSNKSKEKQLFKARGQQRTDSTHVLVAIRVMNRLELVTKTLRVTLNDLTTVAPEWLRSVAHAEWHTRCDVRAEQTRLPKTSPARWRWRWDIPTSESDKRAEREGQITATELSCLLPRIHL